MAPLRKGDKVFLPLYKTTGTVWKDEDLHSTFVYVTRDDTKMIQTFYFKNIEILEGSKNV